MGDESLLDLIALQCQGVRTESGEAGRRGGAGPSDDKAFLFGDHPVMIPTLNRPARRSAFTIVAGTQGLLELRKADEVLGNVTAVPRPRFYDGWTADGVSYEKIARLHGADCLASTVVQQCYRYDDPDTRCRFCAIGVSLSKGATIHTKTPGQLAEVALAAKTLDGVRHVTLTSGTVRGPDRGASYLGECAEAIKRASGLPVQAQFEPPDDEELFAVLKRKGVDDVGLHVESFDERVRARMTPGKAEISVATYFQAFEAAVRVFGRGKVSTYVILGLGEDEALTLEGCRRAAELGVYPFVVPLRPLMDTFLAKAIPPDADYMHRMYAAVGEMLRRYRMSSADSNAGCVKCGACSLLQFRE